MIHLEYLSEHPLDYISDFQTTQKLRIKSCPNCNTRRTLHLHGVYYRYIIWYKAIYYIPIQRHLCVHCRKTVSVMPSFCHPRFQLSLPYLLKILLAFFKAFPLTYNLARQHQKFIINRFLLCMNRLVEFFRVFYDPLIIFPAFEHEKAIKLLEMVTNSGKPDIFAKRFKDHFKIGFMAL